MTVITTIEELNSVIQHFSPKYPRQNLESIESNECFYVLNSVPVKIILQKDRRPCDDTRRRQASILDWDGYADIRKE